MICSGLALLMAVVVRLRPFTRRNQLTACPQPGKDSVPSLLCAHFSSFARSSFSAQPAAEATDLFTSVARDVVITLLPCQLSIRFL